MKKNLLLLLVAALVLYVLLSGVKIQSVEEYYQTHLEDIKEDSQTVTLSIRCDAALEQPLSDELRALLPEDGEILPPTRYVLRSGDSVLDILLRAVRHERIALEYQGTTALGGAYVEGIQYLYEFSCGSASGWVYRVNGTMPNVSCSRCLPEDGDVIEWIYTCNLGQDVEGS